MRMGFRKWIVRTECGSYVQHYKFEIPGVISQLIIRYRPIENDPKTALIMTDTTIRPSNKNGQYSVIKDLQIVSPRLH